MKILISSDSPTAHYYQRLGLARALNACGHHVVMWDCHNVPALDIFEEFEPDIFIGQSYNLNRPLMTAIKERPTLRVILKAGDWPAEPSLFNDYSILLANDQEKENVFELCKFKALDYLFIHYHKSGIDKTHAGWLEHGVPVVSDLNAADIFEYTNGEYISELSCDIAFVGGYWGYKSRTLDEYMVDLCNNTHCSIKIYGNQPWPVYHYCGYIRDDMVKHALASAKICLNIHEPHSQKFGWDIVERPFKLLSNKCFVLSDYVDGLVKLIPDGIVYFRNQTELYAAIDEFLSNPEQKQEYIYKGYAEVMKNHTYFDRAATIFTHLGNHDEYEKVVKTKKIVMEQMGL